jgi:hypothetical protein
MTLEPSVRRSQPGPPERSGGSARSLLPSRSLAVSVKWLGWSVCVFDRSPARLWILPVVPLGLRLSPLDDHGIRPELRSCHLFSGVKNKWVFVVSIDHIGRVEVVEQASDPLFKRSGSHAPLP